MRHVEYTHMMHMTEPVLSPVLSEVGGQATSWSSSNK